MNDSKILKKDSPERRVVFYDTDKLTNQKILRPGLKLIGAKTKQRAFLYKFFPKNLTWTIEPFMGTAGVTIGNPHSVLAQECADINMDAVRYYLTLQSHPEEFWAELQVRLDHLYCNGYDAAEWGRSVFESWKSEIDDIGYSADKDKTVKSAVLFYLITKHCFNGIWRRNESGKVNSSYCKTIKSRGVFNREWFDKVVAKVKNVRFYYRDFEDTLSRIGQNPDPFIFLDPPYRRTPGIEDGLGCVTDYNGKRFTDEDQIAIRYHLGRIKAKWLLTINDDPWIRSLYEGYYIADRKVFYSCSNTKEGRGERPELLIANYDIKKRYTEVLSDIERNAKRKGEILE